MNLLKRLYDQTATQVHSFYAIPLLAFLFFIEATIFFIPVDPVLIMYCIERQNRVWYFATIATLASVIGGLFGYAIGFLLWGAVGKQLVALIMSPLTFARAVDWFKHYEAAAVLIAGFTPVPYKAMTISAGFCQLPLVPFMLYSFIARGARFYLIAGIIHYWGPQIKQYIDRYFNLFVVLFLVLVLGAVWLIKCTAEA